MRELAYELNYIMVLADLAPVQLYCIRDELDNNI